MIDENRPEPVDEELLLALDFGAIAQELREHPSYEKNLKNARSLIRGTEFGITLIVMKTGGVLKEHYSPSPGAATVLEGEIEFTVPSEEKSFRLSKLQSIAFSPDKSHIVEATEETLLLLTFGQRS